MIYLFIPKHRAFKVHIRALNHKEIAKVLGRVEGLSWTGDISARLPEYVEPGAVFPLQALDANIVRRHPGPLDAPVCDPHQIDGDPDIYVSTRPRVGFPPLCCRAAGYPFQGSRRLHN